MIHRRDFLKLAGGVTFLAPLPAERGVFAASASSGPRPPLFTVLPDIQRVADRS